MAFILSQARASHLALSIPHQLEAAKIFQNGNSIPAEDLHAFFGKRAITIRKIADRSLRAIGELQRDNDILRAAIQRSCVYLNSRRAYEKGKEVDEVTDLADYPASTLLGIIQPVIR